MALDASDPVTLDQLRVFVEVVEAGSFSAAARAMRRAQSAVSYAVANLERLLGVELFVRDGHVPRLSDAGEALLPEARAVRVAVSRLQDRARAAAGGVEPRLALVVSVMFPMERLVAAIGAFRDEYPTVALTLNTEILGGVAQAVLDRVCRIGVSEPLPQWPEALERKPIGAVPIVHVAAPTHALAKKKGLIPTDELRDHVQIVVSDRSKLTEGIDAGVLSARTWRVADLATKHAFVRAGFGWGGMPLHLVRRDLASRRLVRIRPAQTTPAELEVPLMVVYRAEEPPGPAGRWLVDRLRTRPIDRGRRR